MSQIVGLVSSIPLLFSFNLAYLQVALLAVEIALLGATLLLIIATRREIRARDLLLQHVSMATDAISRQEYFDAVISAIQASTKYVYAMVTGTTPTPDDADVVKLILDSVGHASSRGIAFRYLLPDSPDRLEMAKLYMQKGAEVKFHPDIIVNDARFMIMDDSSVIIGVPGSGGKGRPTRNGHHIGSESIAHVFKEMFDMQWESSDAKTYSQFLSELVAKARQFNPDVSSAVIAKNLKIDKEDVESVYLKHTERKFKTTA